MLYPDHEKNRTAWNEMVEIHYRHPRYKVKEFLEGWSSLLPIELEELGDVRGRELLHLMCQFGMDTLSWARRGAVVSGVDISDKSIELANKLMEKSGIKASFFRSDILELIGVIDQQFDIVYQSYGTICWLSNLEKWARVVSHYLKSGGFFFIVDDHPILTIFADDNCPYLHKEPVRYSNERDYCDRDYIIKNELVEFQHPLSSIINALIAAGLTIENIDEYDKGYYPIKDDWYEKDGFWYPPGGPPMHPLMFSLKARKV